MRNRQGVLSTPVSLLFIGISMSMTESFAELFEESLKTVDMVPGAIVTGVVIDIDKDWVTVHAGLKSEGVIPVEQFRNEAGELHLQF